MNSRYQALMLEATRLTQAGRLKEATDLIQRAMHSSLAADGDARESNFAPSPATEETAESSLRILDGCAYVVLDDDADITLPVFSDDAATATDTPRPNASTQPQPPQPEAPFVFEPGSFTSGLHTHQGRTCHYKFFTPAARTGEALPMVVMLHGCTQDPDDFAAGTRMNELAQELGFFVLYPAQSKAANSTKCWNWFREGDQQRGSGEPALLAGMTEAVVREHRIDARRVYIAGLSAGGAMAAITAAAYPEIFAAVGVHSGLPLGAAKDLPGAMMAMRNGPGKRGGPGLFRQANAPGATPVPTIVFHGDQDKTVNPRNGESVIAATLEGIAGTSGEHVSGGSQNPPPEIEQGLSGRGIRYTRTRYRNESGNIVAEHWILHGAGHAWSGGDSKGSYTAPGGPDASREMLRFFQSHSNDRRTDPV